ncbi:MAG: hypothetical protein ABIF10_04630 [Candidatus Woesearchaeota archaeon]
MNSKGFELSVNFIVIMIIALVIFVGGLYFTNKFFNMAIDEKQRLDRDTEQAIEDLIMQGEKVAIPSQKKVLRRGSSAVFGLGISNTQRTSQTFYVTISFAKAYKTDNTLMDTADQDFINNNWIFSDLGSFEIGPNKQKSVPILVEVKGAMSQDHGTERGTYVFDVCVCTGSQCDPCLPQDSRLYDNFVHKIYVEVS